eukprot:1163314-Amphidinium_carterae.1
MPGHDVLAGINSAQLSMYLSALGLPAEESGELYEPLAQLQVPDTSERHKQDQLGVSAWDND